LRALDGRRVAILGDMGELGDDSHQAHADLDISGLDAVYLVGPRMKVLADANVEITWFASTADAVAALSMQCFAAGDSVLVKASRSMRLEAVVQLLSQKQEVAHAV